MEHWYSRFGTQVARIGCMVLAVVQFSNACPAQYGVLPTLFSRGRQVMPHPPTDNVEPLVGCWRTEGTGKQTIYCQVPTREKVPSSVDRKKGGEE